MSEVTETNTNPPTKTGFLEESSGVKSTTRLVTIIWAIFAPLFTIMIYIKSGDIASALMAFGTIGALASGNKLLQKPMEKPPTLKD